MTARLAFLQHLADTVDGRHVVFDQTVDLLGQHFIGLAKIFPPFTVTYDAVVHVDGLQHLGRHLTRVGSLVVGTAVLCSYVETLLVKLIVRQHFEIWERWTNDDFAIHFILFIKAVKDIIDQSFSLIESEVHFPVSCYDFASHDVYFLIRYSKVQSYIKN